MRESIHRLAAEADHDWLADFRRRVRRDQWRRAMRQRLAGLALLAACWIAGIAAVGLLAVSAVLIEAGR